MNTLLSATGHPLDQIVLQGIQGRGRHGVLIAERQLGQIFVVDLTLHLDLSPASASDDLGLTVNYAHLAEEVHALIVGEPVRLLETLAERIAKVVLIAPVVAVDVTVHKPQAPVSVPFADVSVRVRRYR